MIIGAHPDDPDGMAGGTAMLWRELGHSVTMVSMTDGGAGHHLLSREQLVERRAWETRAAAKVMDVKYVIMPIPDTELLPTLENRHMLIRLMRQKNPDLVITHRPLDYHPDHRYTSQLVSDSSYLLCVPLVVPDTPAIKKRISYFYEADLDFNGSRKDVCVPIDSVWQRKLQVWHQHESQMYEWLPWASNLTEEIPADEKGRLDFLNRWRGPGHMRVADRFRDLLKNTYGQEAEKVKYAEAFSNAPIGAKPSEEALDNYFTFKSMRPSGSESM